MLTSVHFWAKKQSAVLDEYTVDYIHQKLTDLKPDAAFNRRDVENVIHTLEFNEFL